MPHRCWFLLALLLAAAPAAAVVPGQPAPAFEQAALSGDATVRLADYAGKVVYLDFWASWCAPCVASLPWMETLRQEFAAQGFEVLAINVDETPADGSKFLRRFSVTYPVIGDRKGLLAALYDVKDMPSSYLIDRQGIVRQVHRGFNRRDAKKLREAVRALVQPNP